jgi:hypothetical protein
VHQPSLHGRRRHRPHAGAPGLQQLIADCRARERRCGRSAKP